MQGPRDTEIVRVRGPISYGEGLVLQQERRSAVERGQNRNALFLLEHTPTITLGRRAHPGNILVTSEELAAAGIEIHKTDRGGDVTYHGPGQMVAYPVLNLEYWRKSIRWYLRALEEVLIRVLTRYGLKGERIAGLTGVWVQDAKVAAIGVGIHNWVTFHGVALNVSPNMAHFGFIVPCGIKDKSVTSLETIIGEAPSMDDVMHGFEMEFLSLFGVKETWPGV
jgi:lipoyl(octanoyl) transferase